MPLSSAAKRRTGPIPAKGWIGARNYCAIRFLEGMDGAGWVPVDSLIAAMKHKPNMDELYEVVESSEKRRFVLDLQHAPPRIRAAQGHSIQLEQAPELEPVKDDAQVSLAVHSTTREAWELIQGSGQLERMTRTHVHFSTMPGHIHKGARGAILLRLDLASAMEAGLEFFLASNGVLLCEGPVPLAHVQLIQEGDLPEEWRAARKLNQGRANGKERSGGKRRGVR